jgi:hypothetical protein
MTIERGSTKFGPVAHEELDAGTRPLVQGRPVSARADGARIDEEPDGDETIPPRGGGAAAAAGAADETGAAALAPEQVAARSRLARALEPGVFPADRQVLLATAEEEHADDDVLASLRRLPSGRTFATVAEVFEALGGETEHRPGVPPGTAPAGTGA